MQLIESLLANLNRELRLAKYIETTQLYTQAKWKLISTQRLIQLHASL